MPEELADCEALMQMVDRVAREEAAEDVVVLGDLHHTHNVIRAEVMAFWLKFVAGKTLMVGNHDYAGEGSDIHALMAYTLQARVVDHPILDHGVVFMPYYSDREKFVSDARKWGGKTLVCHQTFHGAAYENGFLAEDGVDPNMLPQEAILSGHIHTPQSFGKVTYLGAPRWRTLSDANVDRAIWLYEFDDEGRVLNKTAFDTGDTCRQIRYIQLTPETPLLPKYLDPKHDWRIDVRGPTDFVEQWLKVLAPMGARVRAFRTDKPTALVRESEGIDKAFDTYLTNWVARHGTDVEKLRTMAKERLFRG